MVATSDYEMMIRGNRAACEEFISKLPWFEEEPNICQQQGNDDDMMFSVGGCCEGTLDEYIGELADLAADENIEFEAFAFDSSEPEGIEHYHYKGSECILSLFGEFKLYVNPDVEPDDMEEMYPELEYYQQSEDDENVYILKDEYQQWDFDDDYPKFHFTMPFDDLK